MQAVDSYAESEIRSTYFDTDETGNCMSMLREADQKTVDIAENIVQLKNELCFIRNSFDDDPIMKEGEIRCKTNILANLFKEYRIALNQVVEMAKIINFDVGNLECKKINVDQHINDIERTETVARTKDCEEELIDPVIILNKGSTKPKIFICDKNNESKSMGKENESCCSYDDESENDECSGCEDSRDSNNSCDKLAKQTDNICEKEAIRNELMTLKGKMNLLVHQNRDLLNKLNCSNKKTAALSTALQNKSAAMPCKADADIPTEFIGNIGRKSKTCVLLNEINRLRNELKTMKCGRCRMELERKNCLDSATNKCDNKTKPIKNTEDYEKLLANNKAKSKEIESLQKRLNQTKRCNISLDDQLMISREQVVQLEKQLFELNSAKALDPEVAASNDKYLVENLRHLLKEANDENNNVKMLLEFQLSELEDKSQKYLAILQTNTEQKQRIENLCKEKNTIAKEYEAEFNRMNDYLNTRIEEIEKLPSMLAIMNRDLENEKFAKEMLKKERDDLLNEKENLRISLMQECSEGYEKKIKDMEEKIIQLRATVKNLDDTLAENKRLYKERAHYSLQLKDHLNAVREEAAIQVIKTKDFSECQKLKYTENIQKLEQQLAESRASACLEFEKRDRINERLRTRVDVLTKHLDEARKKIEELSRTKRMVGRKMEENMCKIPQAFNLKCEEEG